MSMSPEKHINTDEDEFNAVLATIPAGSCRTYSTSELVCATIIADGASVWIQDGETAAEQGEKISSMASLLGAACMFSF